MYVTVYVVSVKMEMEKRVSPVNVIVIVNLAIVNRVPRMLFLNGVVMVLVLKKTRQPKHLIF
jgi:hypothetical protein